MDKFANDINDYLADNRVEELSELFSKFSEEFVKSAEILLPEEMESLPNEDFGLIIVDGKTVLRKYACSSPELTILNTELLLKDASTIPDEFVKVAGWNLAKACHRFGYTDGLTRLAKVASKTKVSNVVSTATINKVNFGLKKEASLEIEKAGFALPDEKRYPITNKEEVQQAIEYFNIYEDKFKQAEKLVYAWNTAAAARTFGVPISEESKISKYASLNPHYLNQQVGLHLELRKNLVDEKYEVLYDELKTKTSEFETNPLAFADILTKVDTEAGLAPMWGGIIENPVIVALDRIKTASIKIDGRTVTLNDIKQLLEHEKIGEVLDSYTLNELHTIDALDVFSTLPTPVREELYKLL